MKFFGGKSKVFFSGGVLVVALVLYNFLNFLFNAILGRVLSPDEFGIITLLNTLWILILIPINALYSVVNLRVSYLTAKKVDSSLFIKQTNRKVLMVTFLLFIIWIILSGWLSSLFKLPNNFIFLSFSPVIVLGALIATSKGFLQGNLFFSLVAASFLSEGISKLVLAILLLKFSTPNLVYLSIPLAILISFITTYSLAKYKMSNKKVVKGTKFPMKTFNAFLIISLSSTAFVSVDVLMAKLFLTPTMAGQYSLLSLVGKMIFYFGSLINVFVITAVNHNLGKNKNPENIFYPLISIIIFGSFMGFLLLGILGNFVVPIIFGDKTLPILPYLIPYCSALACYTTSSTIVTFNLARHRSIFAYSSFLISSLMVIGLILNHQQIINFVQVIFVTSFLNLIVALLLHYFYQSKPATEEALVKGYL